VKDALQVLMDIPQNFPLNSTLCKQGLEFRRWTSDKPRKTGIVSFLQVGSLFLELSRQQITKGIYISCLLMFFVCFWIKNIP
jgi:hypothetical protein